MSDEHCPDRGHPYRSAAYQDDHECPIVRRQHGGPKHINPEARPKLTCVAVLDISFAMGGTP